MNIAIAEDHKLIIDGLTTLLEAKGHSVFYAMNSEELEQLLKEEVIHVLIQDIRFGSVDARTIIPNFLNDYPKMKIVALSSLEDYATIKSVMALGVHGYLAKTQSPELIFDAIEAVFSGQTYLCPESKKINSKNKDISSESVIQLSTREREVLASILAEKSTKEIANSLCISEKTVEYYRSNLFLKFGVKNVSGLVKRAILQGFFS
ncbi:MAG TPA: response regulator transcription factor [Brumimicrobium sp.]|nr:response regulator transcription factor [Brumimicrobium sp.]